MYDKNAYKLSTEECHAQNHFEDLVVSEWVMSMCRIQKKSVKIYTRVTDAIVRKLQLRLYFCIFANKMFEFQHF